MQNLPASLANLYPRPVPGPCALSYGLCPFGLLCRVWGYMACEAHGAILTLGIQTQPRQSFFLKYIITKFLLTSCREFMRLKPLRGSQGKNIWCNYPVNDPPCSKHYNRGVTMVWNPLLHSQSENFCEMFPPCKQTHSYIFSIKIICKAMQTRIIS